MLHRIAEQHGLLHQVASKTLSRVAQNRVALPVLLNCLKSPSRAVNRGARPADGAAANTVSSTAAEVIETQLEGLEEGEMLKWLGDLVETLVRLLLQGLAHRDSRTQMSCRYANCVFALLSGVAGELQ